MILNLNDLKSIFFFHIAFLIIYLHINQKFTEILI